MTFQPRIWRVALISMAFFFAGACTSTTQEAQRDGVTVLWQRTDDVHAACEEAAGRKELFAIRGCSKWYRTAGEGRRICTIYAPQPRSEMDKDKFVTLGHELMHCFDGAWHDKWGRMIPSEQQAAAGASRRPPQTDAAAAAAD